MQWIKGAISKNRSCVNFIAINQEKRKNPWRGRAVCTWQNCQPCRVKGYPNRVTRQARVFPSILKSYIPNIENLNLFVRGVNTGGLENKGSKKRARQRDDCGGALEPSGLVPAAPGGAGRQEIPSAAHPQSPQPRETWRDTGQLTSAGPSPHRRHHLDVHATEHMEKWAHRVLFDFVFIWIWGVGFQKVWCPEG